MPSVTVGSGWTIHFRYPDKEKIIETNKMYGINSPNKKLSKNKRKANRRRPMSLGEFATILSNKNKIR